MSFTIQSYNVVTGLGRNFKGSLWAQILLNMTLNTVGAIEKCLLSFDKTPHISNGIIFQLQVFLIIKWKLTMTMTMTMTKEFIDIQLNIISHRKHIENGTYRKYNAGKCTREKCVPLLCCSQLGLEAC